jgi:hypothetical protein
VGKPSVTWSFLRWRSKWNVRWRWS